MISELWMKLSEQGARGVHGYPAPVGAGHRAASAGPLYLLVLEAGRQALDRGSG